MSTLYKPEYLYTEHGFEEGAGLLVDDSGRVLATGPAESLKADAVVSLPRKALMPGLVNAHSHSFQRLIRGMAESRVISGKDFWSWRGTMYHAAASLSLEDIYDVARMAFLEMLMSGTTTVGEFHYLHNAPDGSAYEDPNAAGRQILAAARSVGIRIVLLRSAYFRAGFELETDPGQARFYESCDRYVAAMEALTADGVDYGDAVHFGVAPHSLRAVPLRDLRKICSWAADRQLPIHMHVSEQVAENTACAQEYGATPITLLAGEGVLGDRFTAVHAIHIGEKEAANIADARASVCSCPTTERNLGDGVIAADLMMRLKIPICFGSDSQTQIDPLEDARELDYHLRLEQQQRAVLDQIDGQPMAKRLFECATVHGAQSLRVQSGSLSVGRLADFFTVDLDDASIAGHARRDLLPLLVFGVQRSAVRDVAVQGKLVLRGGTHPLQEEIVARYIRLHRKVWGDREGVH